MMQASFSQRPHIYRWGAAVLAVVLSAAAMLVGAGAASAADDYPTATSVGSVPTVGPLFYGGLADGHGCSASVIASPSRDLVLTAAHCISGTGAGVLFAPGYLNDQTPYGVWTVISAYVDTAWKTGGDTQHDFAILRVAPQMRGGHETYLQSVTGANVLGFTPRPGTTVTIPAYPAGVDDAPISCTNQSYLLTGYTAFNCHGYFGGTSGSPFLVATGNPRVKAVVGLIGGLHQGGCEDYTSYSSAFGIDIVKLWVRATLRGKPDVVPLAGSDGC
ncbi:V8-like Glu-specific endopeptidase [Nakamurella sp. UYEF19]|uniref:trypsin-like serine peptidase n=1 Tax=Nakamurella sp. UYEF19 TaxID=1756392 RepID=UPI003392D011